jgi:glycine cleavage system H protein
MYPQDLHYSKDHEWIRVDGQRGTVGITDYAQKQLGDVVFVELPAVGRTLKAGESFGTVESVKAVSELYSPVSGEVVEVNASLSGRPETVNSDPHGTGWMIVLKLRDAGEARELMDAAAYAGYVEAEAKQG